MGTDLVIRPAADLAQLAFDDQLSENSPRWRHLTDLVAEGRGQVLVASVGGGPAVGYVALAWNHFFDRDFVDLLYVSSDARRSGAGTALLRAAVDVTTTDTVFTSTNQSNVAMRALLMREGWRVSGSLDGLDPGDPEIVYYLAPSHAY